MIFTSYRDFEELSLPAITLRGIDIVFEKRQVHVYFAKIFLIRLEMQTTLTVNYLHLHIANKD